MQQLCFVFLQEVHLYLKQEKSVFWVLFSHLNFFFLLMKVTPVWNRHFEKYR